MHTIFHCSNLIRRLHCKYLVVHQLEIVIPEHDLAARRWTGVGMWQIRVRVRIQVTITADEQICSCAEYWTTTEKHINSNKYKKIINYLVSKLRTLDGNKSHRTSSEYQTSLDHLLN